MNQKQLETFQSMTRQEIVDGLKDLWVTAKIMDEFPPVHRKIFVQVIDELGIFRIRTYADVNTYTPSDFVIAGLEEFHPSSPEAEEVELQRFIDETMYRLFERPN